MLDTVRSRRRRSAGVAITNIVAQAGQGRGPIRCSAWARRHRSKRLPCGIALVVTLGLTLSGAAPALGQAPCTDFPDVPGALCGSVEVPLDRADPSSATTTVSYVLLPRRDTSVPSRAR